MSDDIKNRIRKMLTLANDAGASEDEAATALRMATGLMARHGITQADLGTSKTPRAQAGAVNVQRFGSYEVALANAAGYLYGCRMIVLSGGKNGLYYVGRPDNIEAAELTLVFLVRQLEALYKQELPSGLTQRARSEFRRTFKYACAVRVQHRAVKLVEDIKSNDVAAKASTGSSALVVQGYFDRLFAEADAEVSSIAGLKTLKSKGARMGSGTSAGLSAGDRVRLRQELG